MAGTHILDSGESERNLECSNLIELQALKFAKEFSVLYKSEKKKRMELEVLSGELKERNEELMDILFLNSSQFLEPINNIETNFLFIREHECFPQMELVERCNEIEKSMGSLHQRVNEMSKLYRIKSMRSLFRPVSLDKILADMLQDMKPTLQKKGRTVQVERLPVLETDSVQLSILFRHLILLGTRIHGLDKPSSLKIKAEHNARGLWRMTFKAKGTGFMKENFALEKNDRRRSFDRRLGICQRISRRLGGFLYGEMVSEDIFSCHFVLPEKNIPQVSQLKKQAGDF